MSYPEGTPLHWVDTDPQAVFVAVVYKRSDLSWISSMISRLSVVSAGGPTFPASWFLEGYSYLLLLFDASVHSVWNTMFPNMVCVLWII